MINKVKLNLWYPTIRISTILCLLILGIFTLSMYNIDLFIKRAEEKLTVSVFLIGGFSYEDKVNDMISQIKKILNVKNVYYISQDKALNEFVLRNPALAEQVMIFDDIPLPASLEVNLVRPVQLEPVKNIVTEISKLEGVASVEYSEMEMKKLIKIRKIFNDLYLVFSVILIGVTILIILQLSCLNYQLKEKQKTDLSLKSLDGLKSLVKESIVFGLFSGVLALLLLYGLFNIFVSRIPQLEFLPLSHLALILILSMCIPSFAVWWCYRKCK